MILVGIAFAIYGALAAAGLFARELERFEGLHSPQGCRRKFMKYAGKTAA